MIQTIRSAERFHVQEDWLNTYWHFSFDHYNDPNNMQFGPLRVFNDDVIAPGGGFPLHGHREMEIVTYVIEGALEHRDDMGNTGVIRPGEIQRMSAGTGVRHSEFNHSKKEPVHLVQLWIFPAVGRLAPSWEQKGFSLADRAGKLLPIAVPANGKAGQPHAAAASGNDLTHSPVSAWMTKDPEQASPDATVEDALQLMLLHGFRHLPVFEDREVRGVVSLRDLAAARISRPAPRG